MDGDERRKVRFGGGSSDEDEGMEMQERKVPVLKINSNKGKDKYKDLFVVEPSSSDEEDDEADQVRFRLPVRPLRCAFLCTIFHYLLIASLSLFRCCPSLSFFAPELTARSFRFAASGHERR
jgi:hypothetical protein